MKKNWNPNTDSENIQTGHKDGICHGKMFHAHASIRSWKRHVREGIERPDQEKNQNAQRKIKLEILTNTRSGHHQTCGDERNS